MVKFILRGTREEVSVDLKSVCYTKKKFEKNENGEEMADIGILNGVTLMVLDSYDDVVSYVEDYLK